MKPYTLLRIRDVKPSLGTYVIVEAAPATVYRIAIKCPECFTVYWDFFGVNGRKLSKVNRVALQCVQCVKDWNARRDEFYRTRPTTYTKHTGFHFREPYPKRHLLPRDTSKENSDVSS